MVVRLNGSIFSPFNDLMLSCSSIMYFVGYLRCGEFTIKSRILDKDLISIQDVSDHTKPVGIMHDFRLIRISQGTRPDSPFLLIQTTYL